MKSQEFFVRHEFGSDSMTLEAAQAAPRFPIYAVLDHIRSAHNVGSMFRTADGARAAQLLLCGYTPTPPHRHLSKTALGAVDVVPWQHCETLTEAIDLMRVRGAQILAVEKTDTSVPLHDCELQFPVALVMGNEVDGLSDATIAQCDATVHLPMYGLKNSLNVSVAFGIVLYEVLYRYERLNH
ncbi:MAG: RNA methyltransferase [Abitibacteriaceae bacterium]|nr:RNA methyltransferase [Abditibacteriaceae bacterium]MBV9868090.1 RNA methyltransferase [Abditibacteriaceae bacterium]